MFVRLLVSEILSGRERICVTFYESINELYGCSVTLKSMFIFLLHKFMLHERKIFYFLALMVHSLLIKAKVIALTGKRMLLRKRAFAGFVYSLERLRSTKFVRYFMSF